MSDHEIIIQIGDEDGFYEEDPRDYVGNKPPAYGKFQKKHTHRKKLHRKRVSSLEVHDNDAIEASSPVPSLRRDASNLNLHEGDGDFFDPDYDFDCDDHPYSHDDTSDHSQKTYELACKRLGILPSQNFIKALRAPKVTLAHQEMGSRALKPCIIALVRNTKVLDLDISGNSIGPVGAEQISSLLSENMFITTLNLSDNGLKSEGAKIITDVLRDNRLITILKLSGNGFVEGDAACFAAMIKENAYLTELDLSHNGFREHGGIVLADALENNKYLEKLDLSWNHLRRRGAMSIAKALAVNDTLTHLNLAWNGFGAEGCSQLCDNLPKNTTLLELDLTCNRIDRACLNTLLRGVGANKSLQVLKLTHNPITSEGATAIMTTIEQSPKLPLQFLDISSQCVESCLNNKLRSLNDAGRKLSVKHGVVLEEKEQRKDHDDFTNEDPMMVLMEFMRLRNLRLMDLFAALDRDGDKSLTREEFREGLMGINVPMTTKALNRLINKLDEDGDGEVDFGELMAGQKEHKRRLAKMAQEAKERGIMYEDTDMGRLTKKLKTILAFTSNNNKMKAAANATKAINRMKKVVT